MSSMKRKIRLAGAVTLLLLLAALGISCKGFFVNPTLSSLTINPTAPNVEVGTTTTLKAFGVYNDGSGGYITSNVSWASSDPTVASVTGNGNATLTGIATGTATITATSQSVSGTSTATVFLVITQLTISPTSASIATGNTQNFTVTAATSQGTVDVSSSATINPEANGTTATGFTCASGASPIVCTNNSATAGTYQFVASYPGSSLTATATVTVP